MSRNEDLSLIDRATRSVGVKLSRRSLFTHGAKGGLVVLAGVAGLQALTPIEVSACSGCHYCVSGCTNCNQMTCCSYNTGSCLICYSNCGPYHSYIKDYICDNFCDYWCATAPC